MMAFEQLHDRRPSLPDSLLSVREDEELRPAEELRKGTAQWLHPRADASPMPWGASSVHSDRSSIISVTNERRRRSSMLSNPESLFPPPDDLSRCLTAADKFHRRRSSEGNMRTVHPVASSSSLASPRSIHVPLSPKLDTAKVSFDNARPFTPSLHVESPRMPHTPRFGSLSMPVQGLEAWQEGDSFDDHNSPQPTRQSSASQFAQASRASGAMTPPRPAVTVSLSTSPDDSLRSHVGIVGLGEGWGGGPQRDKRGKKVKASKLAASDPLALWNEEPVAGPSTRGLASYSVRSFWARSMQNLGFAESTISLHAGHVEAWSEEPVQRLTAGEKAKRLFGRFSIPERSSSREGDDRRRQSLAIFSFPLSPDQSSRERFPASPSVPSFHTFDQSPRTSRTSSRLSRRAFSPFSPQDLPIPARQSSLAVGSSHPFLQPAIRVDNVPGGLLPPRRPRHSSPFTSPVISAPPEQSSVNQVLPRNPRAFSQPPPPQVDRRSHRRSKTFGVADIASEVAEDDARAVASAQDDAVQYVPLAQPADSTTSSSTQPPLQRRRSMLNRLKSKVSPSPSNSDAESQRGSTGSSIHPSISQASPDAHPAPVKKSLPAWRRFSSFSRSPKETPTAAPEANETPVKARPSSMFGGLRSPSMLRLSSPRKTREPAAATPTPTAEDYRVAQIVVEEMLSYPSTAQSSASEITPATSVESLRGALEAQHAAHRLSRLSEIEDEAGANDDTRRRRQSPYSLNLDLGGKGLNLPAMLASCDDLSARLDAEVRQRQTSHTRGLSASAAQPSPPQTSSHTRHQSMPVDLVEICKATSSADDLSSIADVRLAFPIPPANTPPSPETDQLEQLMTPHDPSKSFSTQQLNSPPRHSQRLSVVSAKTDRRLSAGFAQTPAHRLSDAGSAFSLISTEGSDLEFNEPQRAHIRPARQSPPSEGIHHQPFFLHTSPVMHATRA